MLPGRPKTRKRAEGEKTARVSERSANQAMSVGKSRITKSRTVTPLWPPTTGTTTEGALPRSPRISATKVEARTTSNVVTPNSLAWRRGVNFCPYAQKQGFGIPLGIENTVLLENLGNNGHSRVDRVGNDKNESFRSSRCDASCQVTDDARVDLSSSSAANSG